MIENICKNIYRIAVPLPHNPLKELNSYYIQGKKGEKSLLIDTGFRIPQCREALLQGLDELHAKPEDYNIFLTHLHADHSGLAPEVVSENGKIYVSSIDSPYLSDPDFMSSLWKKSEETYAQAGFPLENLTSSLTKNPSLAYAPKTDTKHYVNLEDADELSVGGYHFSCILTPGHTPGHMCLWDKEHRLMFTGDCVLFDITPNITSWFEMKDALGSYLQTLKRLQSYPVELALPGHRSSGNFQERIIQLQKHHEVRLAEVESIVKQTPGQNAYSIAGQMKWKIKAKNWEEFPVAQKFFAIGECQAHLDHLLALEKLYVKTGKDSIKYYYPI